MKPEVVILETEEWEKQYLSRALRKYNVKFIQGVLQNRHLKEIESTQVLCPFIYSKISKDILKALPNLELVATRSTGFDHIDLSAAKKLKIKVANVPHYGENTVAEHTFALILSLSRKIHQSYERTSHGDFSLDGLRGFDLKGKTIGIVGCGSIGRHVVRMAQGFEMNVVVVDPHMTAAEAKKLKVKRVSLNQLLKESDIVSLHVPYTKENHHLINRKNIRLMKKGSLLINTARGGLVDTTALIDALRDDTLAGIGLDVLEEETYILKEERELLSPNFPSNKEKGKLTEYLTTIVEGHMLLISDKVIVTPHNAFNSQEALERILDTTVDNINAWHEKRKIENIVK